MLTFLCVHCACTVPRWPHRVKTSADTRNLLGSRRLPIRGWLQRHLAGGEQFLDGAEFTALQHALAVTHPCRTGIAPGGAAIKRLACSLCHCTRRCTAEIGRAHV